LSFDRESGGTDKRARLAAYRVARGLEFITAHRTFFDPHHRLLAVPLIACSPSSSFTFAPAFDRARVHEAGGCRREILTACAATKDHDCPLSLLLSFARAISHAKTSARFHRRADVGPPSLMAFGNGRKGSVSLRSIHIREHLKCSSRSPISMKASSSETLTRCGTDVKILTLARSMSPWIGSRELLSPGRSGFVTVLPERRDRHLAKARAILKVDVRGATNIRSGRLTPRRQTDQRGACSRM
jgi:hypothetical protein